MKILLNKGNYTLIDKEDYQYIKDYKWYTLTAKNGKKYAYTNAGKRGKSVLLHRLIAKPSKQLVVDHRNGNGLDNRRVNLRVCTRSQNQFNSIKPINNTSGQKGVSWSMNQWLVQVVSNGKRVYQKRFKNFDDAVNAYKRETKKFHGEFAKFA